MKSTKEIAGLILIVSMFSINSFANTGIILGDFGEGMRKSCQVQNDKGGSKVDNGIITSLTGIITSLTGIITSISESSTLECGIIISDSK